MRAIAHAVDGRGVDDVDQARRLLLLCEDRGLAAAHDMLGPAHCVRVDGEDLADDQQVEQHGDRSETPFGGRLGG
jgi:hypothetical protein